MHRHMFDEFKDLAQRDPEAFEQLRAELIDDCIRRSLKSHQHRLRGLQFVIDARRRIAASPMKALLEIQTMMYDSVLNLQHTVQALNSAQEVAAPTNAQIIPFRRSTH